MFGNHHCMIYMSKQIRHVTMIKEVYIKSEKYKEIERLETVWTSDWFVSWTKFHSDRNLKVISLPWSNAALL